ncbi:MAG: HNH endonuclease [Phaeodactylibacter sp.]|nr:HNH endonuclease [Phaeodactylibacter sp.]MCB9302646.1 HNH endonuclease [Lewinellaceae bacterium]
MSGRYIPEKLRLAVQERAGERCEYCQSWRRNAIHTFNIDHLLPLDKGGKTELSNLALSCGGCNSAKSNKVTAVDPLTKEEVPVYNPRQHNWNDHFVWSDDFLEVIGLTPIGRASVQLLRLNREGLRNLRRLARMAGEHPPGD